MTLLGRIDEYFRNAGDLEANFTLVLEDLLWEAREKLKEKDMRQDEVRYWKGRAYELKKTYRRQIRDLNRLLHMARMELALLHNAHTIEFFMRQANKEAINGSEMAERAGETDRLAHSLQDQRVPHTVPDL